MLYATDSSTTVKKRLTAGGRAEAPRLCPWGNAIQGFTGAGLHGERDEGFGMYMLGAGYRGYIPSLMRFNSPDNWSPFRRGGINAYAFCGGDPVNGRDPTGHSPVSELAEGLFESIFSQHELMKTLGKYLQPRDFQALGRTSKSMFDSTQLLMAEMHEKLFRQSAKKMAHALNVTGATYSPLSAMYTMGQTVVDVFPQHTREYKYLTGMKPRAARRLWRSTDDNQYPGINLEGPLPKRFSRFLNGVYTNFPTARQGMPEIYEHLENREYALFVANRRQYIDDVKRAIDDGLF